MAGLMSLVSRGLVRIFVAVAVLCIALSNAAAQNLERPWEDPNGPYCFDLYFSTVTSMLNAYNGSEKFNSAKPYSFSPWGHTMTNSTVGAQEPDAWHQFGGNRNQFVWAQYAQNRWGDVDWDSARIPLLRPFVLDCIRRLAAAGGGTSATGPGAGGAAGGGLNGTLTITMSDGRVIVLNAADIITMVYRRGATAGPAQADARTGASPTSSSSTPTPQRTTGTPSTPGSMPPGSRTGPSGSGPATGTGPPTGAGPATSAAPAGPRVDGNTRAIDKRGRYGERFTYDCPAGFEFRSAWGTDIYTDDSSVCTAAVHVGLISRDRGGALTIEMRPGRASYTGSARNGVTTLNYGASPGSFVFIDGSGQPSYRGTVRPAGEQINWSYSPLNLRSRIGQRFTFYCPGGGKPYPGYGSGVYTGDSNVCTAAVHAGVISAEGGGNVTIEIRAGQTTYEGSSRNGVATRSFGRSPGSFVIVGGGR